MGDELSQYNNVCKDRFDDIMKALKALEDRLFHDNGSKSVQSKLNTVIEWQGQHDKETANALIKDRMLTERAVEVADSKNPNLSMEFVFGNWKRIGITLGLIIWTTTITITALRSASSEQVNKVVDKLNTVIQDVEKK